MVARGDGRKTKGKPIEVKLAGDVRVSAAMTQHGEVMLRDSVGWIVPMGRMAKEMGVKVVWSSRGVDVFCPGGRTFPAQLINGLPYIKYDDFLPIRKALITSHHQGRQTLSVELTTVVLIFFDDRPTMAIGP